MNFIEGLGKTLNGKNTENGAYALKSTLNDLLDAFGTLGACRTRAESDIINIYAKAFDNDETLALKMLFYLRDVRGGLGEKRIFKVIAKWLATKHTDAIKRNMGYIPEYGRWDDLYLFVNTPLEDEAFKLLKGQFDKDCVNCFLNKPISLLCKWLKSVNTSSAESNRLGKLTAKKFGLSEKTYRKRLSQLRKYTNVVEVNMSANEWSSIKYENVPSYAMRNYFYAFEKHDAERFLAYENSLSKDPSLIKADTLYPYNLVRDYYHEENPIIEAQWKALPNYCTDNRDFLIMADTSGSMCGLPLEVSVSLAIYFAQRNQGIYHNKFMTFSSTPSLLSLHEDCSLFQAIDYVEHSPWGYSTNLNAAFESILETAIANNLKSEDLPKALVVITDMEIDEGTDGNQTITESTRKKFHDAGLEMPTLVWWNVNARNNTFHSEVTDSNVRFVSGLSASIFKGLIEHLGNTPLELMVEILNDERYEVIK